MYLCEICERMENKNKRNVVSKKANAIFSTVL